MKRYESSCAQFKRMAPPEQDKGQKETWIEAEERYDSQLFESKIS